MQVADITELASSATLGAGKAQRMSMAEDPALYLTMIISLYPNVKLAFIRETICNQWDAHIASGRTDTPIKITIDRDLMLTFRDYGNGIPIEKMDSTYNTLGGSTKRASTAETGGFGLGCKSPIAYAESFKVVTMNNGTKGIYNMVRSSVETDGFPGLVPIMQLPTEESGLEVSIQLRKEDVAEIVGYIRSVVYNGSMKCRFICDAPEEEYDGILPRLDMSFEPGSYNVDSQSWYQRHMGNHAVYIRYGNVVYPALETPATERAIGLINNFLSIIGHPRILVQAKPSSLAVAPSRETLSSQQMTENGITDLVVGLVDKLEADIKARIPAAIQQIIDGIKNDSPDNFTISKYMDYISDYVSDKMVRGYMNSSLWEKQRNHWMPQFQNMELDRHSDMDVFSNNHKLRAKFRKVLKLCKHSNTGRKLLHNFCYNYGIKPLLKELAKLGHHKSVRILIPTAGGYYTYKESFSRVCFSHGIDVFYLMKNKKAFISTRANDVGYSISHYPPFAKVFSYMGGDPSTAICIAIKVGTKKGESEAVAEQFIKAGWDTVNLAEKFDWDPVVKSNRRIAEQKRKIKAKQTALTPEQIKKKDSHRPNRLICIRALKEGKHISSGNVHPHYGERHVDVEKPVYYCMADHVSNWKKLVSAITPYDLIPEDIMDVTIICRNKIEVNKAIKLGAVHIDEWTKAKILEVVRTKDFIKYATKERQMIIPSLNIYSSDVKLMRLLGIKVPGYDKLKFNREYEQILSVIDDGYLNPTIRQWLDDCVITEDEKNQLYDMARGVSFVNRKLFRTYFKFTNDGLLGIGYVNTADLVKAIKAHPELIPAIRTIVKLTIKQRLNS